jgi:hypothetical protein
MAFDELQDKKEISFGVVFNKLKKEYKLQEGVEFPKWNEPKSKVERQRNKVDVKKSIRVNNFGSNWDYLKEAGKLSYGIFFTTQKAMNTI